MFAITNIKVLFHKFNYYWGEEFCSSAVTEKLKPKIHCPLCMQECRFESDD